MADDLRITDLRDPVLTDDQRVALEYAEQLELDFGETPLLDEARRLAGVGDGTIDGAVLDRFRDQRAAVIGDEGLTGLGRLTQHRRFVRLLAQRMRFEDVLRRYPEIHEIELEPPIIVVGLPRSGTTHLVNLIAADRRFRSLPFWESQEPIPGPGDGAGADGVDARFARCATDHALATATTPLIQAMHDRHPSSVEEEVELLDVGFSSYVLEWHIRSEAWRDAYSDIDQRPCYAELKTMLKVLTWQRGPSRWVLKSPQHLEQLDALVATFPDATLAFTHRDPVAVLQSAVTMLAYGDRMRRRAVDLDRLVEYWIDRLGRLVDHGLVDRPRVVDEQQAIDVVFDVFMADDVGMVERIYDRAGIELTARARSQLDAYMAANPRGKHGRIDYDVSRDFGRSPRELRSRFERYLDAFPAVRPEVS